MSSIPSMLVPFGSFRSLPSTSVKASQSEIFGVSPEPSLSHYMTLNQLAAPKRSEGGSKPVKVRIFNPLYKAL